MPLCAKKRRFSQNYIIEIHRIFVYNDFRGDVMLYQKLHLGETPYIFGHNPDPEFPEHRHPEIELFYCISGSYNLTINKKDYMLQEGELAVIGSMLPHKILDPSGNKSSSLFIEVGPTMLGNYFKFIGNKHFKYPILDLKTEERVELNALFNETLESSLNPGQFTSLSIKGNIYKISSLILEEFTNENTNQSDSKEIFSIIKIESALEHIYSNYNKRLSLEEVADLCGYSKSNFCKIFKSITGDTFHHVLNDYRVKMACTLLEESELSVEDIATSVGFADSKTFCRIFKELTNVTPSQYRKK